MVKIEFRFPKWFDAVNKNYATLMTEVAATVQTNRGMLFDSSGAYNGHTPWKPLKMRHGQPLSKTGTLRRSISPSGAMGKPGPDGIVRFSGNVVTVGTNIKYAAVHNYGAVIRPKNKQALSWKVGKVRYFAKEVTIPKRPYLEGAWNQQDQDEVNAVLAAKIARILDKGGL